MKLLRGEYTEAKATSKTIPSFWDIVNIVYGASSAGKSSLSAISTLAFVSSKDSATCNADGRVSFSDITDSSGVGRGGRSVRFLEIPLRIECQALP